MRPEQLMWMPRLLCVTGLDVAAQPATAKMANTTKMYFIPFLSGPLLIAIHPIDWTMSLLNCNA
ncbi:hypothetical protein ALP63_101556 [Pseudomonas syringae pv. aceris]|nr:hypothetical protein ALO65_101298 [Pseudomonas syringae pv. papulans]RMN72964.1 hypothetical protein ALQ56_101714 [Pseudomonas syringae pv. papulans]RMS21945.1 hypothetical protein ALP69_101231 [Pseudomonas syringae pv. aceris]RMS59722.1 hypothetical protein ALP63_101556 [Pseudomonas syringae pv. aceris]